MRDWQECRASGGGIGAIVLRERRVVVVIMLLEWR